MINQHPILLKVDHFWLGQLDMECYVSGKKRNDVINVAIQMYIDMAVTARRLETIDQTKAKLREEGEFMRRWLCRV